MLVVFAPQALLYGLSVVLYGLLQAYRRFAGPAIGPAISSLVLIAAYLSFVPLAKGLPLATLPLQAELVLSVGTTLGVAALVVVGAVPTWRLHLRLRPTLRFPPGVARRASGLALVGVAELIAVDAASLVTIALANGRGLTGALVIFNYASQVFNTVAAVLVLSIVTSAFPVLSARDGPVFARTVRRLDPRHPAHVLARCGADRGGRGPGRARPGQAAGSGTATDRGLCPVRPGDRGHRGDRQPGPRHAGHRPAQGRRRRGGRKLGRW